MPDRIAVSRRDLGGSPPGAGGTSQTFSQAIASQITERSQQLPAGAKKVAPISRLKRGAVVAGREQAAHLAFQPLRDLFA
jgi:hypothetical protein